ncbi:hypothetical protein D3C87_1657010 [compost metagenome]
MAAAEFMARCIERCRLVRPERRRIDAQTAPSRLHDACRNADIEDIERAAQGTAGKQQMTRLLRHEGDSVGRRECRAPDLPGSPVDAARQVDGNDGQAFPVDPLDRFGDRVRQIAREACTKKRIDDDISIL